MRGLSVSSFLYFKPGHSSPRVTMDQLAEWGLSYAFDAEPQCRACKFPETSAAGYVFGCEATLGGKVVGIYPDEQRWAKVPGSDCWVGHYKDATPTTESLSRESPLPSYVLQLGNGEDWAIPKVVHVDDGEIGKNLPCKLDVDDEGKIKQGDPIEKYQYLWTIAKPYIEAFLVPEIGDTFDVDSSDILADAVRFLQANYRLGLREAIMLELFPDDLDKIIRVCLCAIDYGTWIDWQTSLKKTNDPPESVGLNSADGKADSHQITDQVLLTS